MPKKLGDQREGTERGWLWAAAGALTPGPSPCLPHACARFQVNINGFLQRQQGDTPQFTVGNEVSAAAGWGGPRAEHVLRQAPGRATALPGTRLLTVLHDGDRVREGAPRGPL